MKQELVPIYRIPPSGITALDSHATGTLMKYDGCCFLATASHVFISDDSRQPIAALMIAGPSGQLIINRPKTVTDPTGYTKETDPIDFGIVFLTSAEVTQLSKDFVFLNVEKLSALDHSGLQAKCHIAGYPSFENEPQQAKRQLMAELYRLDVKSDKRVLRHSIVPRHKRVPEDYIALRYDPREVSPRPNTAFKRPKSFKGMSGGAIFAGYMPRGILGRPIPSRHYIGMFIQADPKQRAGVICAYGLSLVAIHKILYRWFKEQKIQH